MRNEDDDIDDVFCYWNVLWLYFDEIINYLRF